MVGKKIKESFLGFNLIEGILCCSKINISLLIDFRTCKLFNIINDSLYISYANIDQLFTCITCIFKLVERLFSTIIDYFKFITRSF